MSDEEEVWKTFPDIPFVEVSNLGKIRTKDHWVTYKNGSKRLVKGRVLKQQRDRYGYLYVHININGKRITLKVHRMVAITFIPNPDNLPQVNHIDCNRSNNVASNLEWCTNQYNTAYREKYGKASSHPVFAVNVKTGEVLYFKSMGEAERELNISHQDISAVIEGQNKTVHSYWFTEDESEITEEKIREVKDNMRFSGGVIAINLSTQNALYFESQKEAARQLTVNQGNVCSVLKGRYSKTGGFWFCYADENAVEKVRAKFGDKVAKKVEKLISENKKVSKSC